MLNKIRLSVTGFLGLFIILIFSSTNASADYIVDYDGLADLGVFRPSTGDWHTFGTESGSFLTTPWGFSSDVLAPADYDGDGLTDITVWRPENGTWYVRRSRTRDFIAIQWGTVTPVMFGAIPDIPVPADYDGDGQADFAVWRPVDGTWYILTSMQGFNPLQATYYQFGKLGDVPVPADYDGDGKTDFAVFRPSENRWYVFQSQSKSLISVNFGEAGNDLLVPADYTGDGKADIAVYRKGAWIIRDSQDAQYKTQFFGFPTDKPVLADFDGDAITDLAVYRDGTWFIWQSSNSLLKVYYFGAATDIPLDSVYVRRSMVAIP